MTVLDLILLVLNLFCLWVLLPKALVKVFGRKDQQDE